MTDLATNTVISISTNLTLEFNIFPSRNLMIDNKDVVKYSVQKGVHGVSVSVDSIRDIRKIVSDEEAKIILSKR